MDAVAIGQGGYITLPAWRDDIGVVPVSARVSIPSLSVENQLATIMAGGLVRWRVPRALAIDGNAGEHEAIWTLEVPIIGALIQADGDPANETIEAATTFSITSDAAQLDRSAAWRDAKGAPTPAYMREKLLFGVALVDREGRLYPDAALQETIDSAIARIEKRLDITIGVSTFNSIPGYEPESPETVVRNDEPYDYDPERFRTAFGLLRVRKKPLRRVLAAEFWLGAQKITRLPNQWLVLNRPMGDINIIPDALNTLALSVGGVAFPLLRASHGLVTIPHLWRVAYEAGLDLREREHAGLFDLITWVAGQLVLWTLSGALANGLTNWSTSIDGVSESVSTTASASSVLHGAAIDALGKQIEAWMADNEDAYRSIKILV